MKEGTEHILLTVSKCDSRELQIRIEHTPEQGIPYLDLRIWFINGKGKRVRTKEGVTIGTTRLTEVRAALERAIAYFQEHGYQVERKNG